MELGHVRNEVITHPFGFQAVEEWLITGKN
jgi:hypothetical protein